VVPCAHQYFFLSSPTYLPFYCDSKGYICLHPRSVLSIDSKVLIHLNCHLNGWICLHPRAHLYIVIQKDGSVFTQNIFPTTKLGRASQSSLSSASKKPLLCILHLLCPITCHNIWAHTFISWNQSPTDAAKKSPSLQISPFQKPLHSLDRSGTGGRLI